MSLFDLETLPRDELILLAEGMRAKKQDLQNRLFLAEQEANRELKRLQRHVDGLEKRNEELLETIGIRDAQIGAYRDEQKARVKRNQTYGED